MSMLKRLKTAENFLSYWGPEKHAKAVNRAAKRIDKLEKHNAAMRDLLERVWFRWDHDDTEATPALGLDLALRMGNAGDAKYIAKLYGDRIVEALPEYKGKIAKLLK